MDRRPDGIAHRRRKLIRKPDRSKVHQFCRMDHRLVRSIAPPGHRIRRADQQLNRNTFHRRPKLIANLITLSFTVSERIARSVTIAI
jgi:hypothetical protein